MSDTVNTDELFSMRHALQKIADGEHALSLETCECDHSTDDCCALVEGVYCPMCFAGRVLRVFVSPDQPSMRQKESDVRLCRWQLEERIAALTAENARLAKGRDEYKSKECGLAETVRNVAVRGLLLPDPWDDTEPEPTGEWLIDKPLSDAVVELRTRAEKAEASLARLAETMAKVKMLSAQWRAQAQKDIDSYVGAVNYAGPIELRQCADDLDETLS